MMDPDLLKLQLLNAARAAGAIALHVKRAQQLGISFEEAIAEPGSDLVALLDAIDWKGMENMLEAAFIEVERKTRL